MTILSSNQDTFQFISPLINTEIEELWLLALGPGLQLKFHDLIFRGTVDRCLIHPREILRPLILNNSSQFIIIHSHPSGDPTPSAADIRFTKKLKKVGELIEIKLIDHLVVTSTSYQSMKSLKII